ncbi:MAG: TAXI family TRAP transporter solute-binding subunit [Candidatus Lindowbacteria bacterium]|nr:TAXI family TRAP transporter solute-binding subunit [Candidatus Lindowbacteria bacterium]
MSGPVGILKISSHQWVVWVVLFIFGLSLATWVYTRDPLPHVIRIVSASDGGLYHKIAVALARRIEARTGKKVVVLTTKGSVENARLLSAGEADLAIIQAGSTSAEGMMAISRLYPDVLHVVVRRNSGIHQVLDLKGKTIIVGPEGSGMRQLARTLLDHYRIDDADINASDKYFTAILTDKKIDAAIVTTGFINPDLGALPG